MISELTVETLNKVGAGRLPAYMGIVFTRAERSEIAAEIAINAHHMAPNGYLHAGTVVTLADTCAGYGCRVNLPSGATGFTTVELKANFLGTAREGTIIASAKPVHLGRTTHVWDATVTHKESGRTIAMFRCTQMILYSTQR
ncbi:MAG TPA: PaaI family thioesterase [Steroidobacteraceae bacterium]|nr:PaaI family thioesterase [Steroidobacteraceae bacterium]